MTSTRRFAVFGHPVAHSLSPPMHLANFRALGISASYERRDIETADSFRAVLPEFRSGGVNCTIPLKRIAFEACDRRDATAERFGVVNTIRFDADGATTGFNTDGIGFLRALEEDLGCSPAGRSVFIFGCGGAGRAIAITCADAGAATITLANRSPERMDTLAAELRTLAPKVEIRTTESSVKAWTQACRASDLIVQCSSLGLHEGDVFPLTADAFREGQHLYDLVYNIAMTPAMAMAAAAGAKTANGLGMLIHQGAASFTIWTGQPANVNAMRAAITSLLA